MAPIGEFAVLRQLCTVVDRAAAPAIAHNTAPLAGHYVTAEFSSAMHTSVRSKGDEQRQGRRGGSLGVQRGHRSVGSALHTRGPQL